MKTKIDVDRCYKAMESLAVYGSPAGSKRLKAIENAITAIQNDGNKALTERYIGIKNYAGFGDQRGDHEYGYGPKHGYIVFRIAKQEKENKLGTDHIYLLECVRDFGHIKIKEWSPNQSRIAEQNLNLCDVLTRLKKAKTKVEEFSSYVNNATVESHIEDKNED